MFVSPLVTRNVLAVTGACVMIQTRKLENVGGFNEELKICGDVELCLRLYRSGLLNVYEPKARLVHHESETRSKAALPKAEIDGTKPVSQEFLKRGDPFYNPNLGLGHRYPSLDPCPRAGAGVFGSDIKVEL